MCLYAIEKKKDKRGSRFKRQALSTQLFVLDEYAAALTTDSFSETAEQGS